MSQSTQFDGARRWSRPVVPLLLSLALLCGARAGAAQVDEVAAGAGGSAVLRGPWVTSGWRKPLPRLALFVLGSLVYERFVDHRGWSWSDFNQRLVSYALADAAVSGVRWMESKRVGAPRIRRDPWSLRESRRGTPLPAGTWPITADMQSGESLRRG